MRRARGVKTRGNQLMEVSTFENLDPEYIANQGSSCYVCKTNLYETLKSVSSYARDLEGGVVLFNGTNADDRLDPTRLGLVAAKEFDVCSPLDHAKKSKVREIARSMGLPNADVAASPCLRSRLALGVEATNLHLRFIDDAESFVRNTLELEPERNMRVRLLPKNRIAIELDREMLGKAQDNLEQKFHCEFEEYSDVEIRGISMVRFRCKILLYDLERGLLLCIYILILLLFTKSKAQCYYRHTPKVSRLLFLAYRV